MNSTITLNKRPIVGIVGAGQLARMMIEAATPLGVDVRLLAARPDDSAAQIWPHVLLGAPGSPAALDSLAASTDRITFDHELVSVPELRRLEAAGHALYPTSATVAVAQDKLAQRTLFQAAGLPVPCFRELVAPADAAALGRSFGWPLVVKASRGGYDGRGVWVVPEAQAAQRLIDGALAAGTLLIAEQLVPIQRELSVLVARRPDGELVVYPPVETVQRDGICREVIAPAAGTGELVEYAACLARQVAEVVGVTGILAVELFQTADGLVLNEIATRPHNSGHFSIEGCVTSQFENHLRAVLDWPLGPTRLTAPAVVMVNLLGPRATEPAHISPDLHLRLPAALAVPGVHIHLYGKEARPGRKVGHVTALGQEVSEVRGRARRAAALLTGTPEEEL